MDEFLLINLKKDNGDSVCSHQDYRENWMECNMLFPTVEKKLDKLCRENKVKLVSYSLGRESVEVLVK